ncbi:LPS export ABC transporter periplasmic protein LptC [Novosphingobium lentum]|uniref:LPS export ABC transporter periplasmic protein LptC n=1 Tax=Novosphingobium lentum TaxID=145287 RepID=UPI00083432DE|nr:LPS export ABC transporter periplasmic protein LptC [Novosphingobium lentum]
MTVQADIIRTRRRRFAAPGGFHDKLVRFLAAALPAGVGVLAAVMVLTPLGPRGEISFLLDRNKVAIVQDRLRVASAMYRGKDNDGRNFSVTAGNAVQHSAKVPVVEMNDLEARMMLDDGPAVLTAGSGNYDMSRQLVEVLGPVNVQSSNGYRMTATNINIDIGAKKLFSRGPVEGRIPAGTFSADRILGDLASRTVVLDGHARLRMEPGALRQ